MKANEAQLKISFSTQAEEFEASQTYKSRGGGLEIIQNDVEGNTKNPSTLTKKGVLKRDIAKRYKSKQRLSIYKKGYECTSYLSKSDISI